MSFSVIKFYHTFLELPAGSRVYNVYADGFYSLAFQSIKACISSSEMMLKVSKKRRADLEKNSKVLAREKNGFTEKQHSMHTFIILNADCCMGVFLKSYMSTDVCYCFF